MPSGKVMERHVGRVGSGPNVDCVGTGSDDEVAISTLVGREKRKRKASGLNCFL